MKVRGTLRQSAARLVWCWLAALSATVAVGQGDRVSALIADLSSEEADTRRMAARELGDLAVWEAAEPLVALLADPNEDVYREVVSALEQIGEGAADALLESLAADAPGVRSGCAQVLGHLNWIEDERIVPALMNVIDDPAADVRLAAIRALGYQADLQAAEELKRALKDADIRVRVVAAWALTKVGDGSGLSVLLQGVTAGDMETRGAAIGGLVGIATPPAIQALRDLTLDEQPEIRRAAYDALIEVRTPETITMALAGLSDPSRVVRRELAHTLGVFKPPGAADALLTAFKTDDSAVVRVAAGIALANMEDERATAILLERLSTEYRDIERAGAADALGTLGVQEAIKPLTELLEDDDPRVRNAARLALRSILEDCPDCPK